MLWLKFAVALVVIRDKPAGQNVKDFVNNLILFHQNKVGWFSTSEIILEPLYGLFLICIFCVKISNNIFNTRTNVGKPSTTDSNKKSFN